jgi:transporter family protein
MRRLSFVITSLLAILFLNEQLNAPKAVGTLLAASALMIIAWTKDQSNRPHRTAYITFVCIGLMGFIHKLAAIAGVSPSAFLMIQAGTAHLGTHLFSLKWGGYNFTRSLVRYGILAGVLIALTMVFGIYALRHGDAVVIAPILQLGFLVNAPLSFVFLGEPATKRKIVGFLLGAVAILCFVAEIR